MIHGLFPKKYLKQINDIFRNFIWDNKHCKILCTILTGLWTDGGTGLADMTHRVEALKISWVYKRYQNPVFTEFADILLNNKAVDKLWSGQLSQ